MSLTNEDHSHTFIEPDHHILLLHFYSNRYEDDGKECLSVEQDLSDDDTEAYVTNLSYYHLVPFETDILE
ncbi:hypothetical protein AOLI_G00258650 [Acnodon oligacanthus]